MWPKTGNITEKRVAMPAKSQEFLRLIGDPAEVDRSLRAFRKATSLLSSEHPRLIDKYPKRWVAIYRGKVKAAASTFNAVLAQVDKAGLPREEVILRFIDKNQRTMILPR